MTDIAVVLGGTGACGRWVIDELLKSSKVSKVYSFVRRLNVVKYEVNVDKLVEVQLTGDFEEDLRSNWPQGAIVAFSCLGTTIKKAGSQEAFYAVDYTMQTTFAAIARENGVKQFHLVSSVGTDAESSNFYLQVKGQVENRIRELEFPRFVAYRPGVLDAVRDETRCGEACALCFMKYLCCCLTCGVLGKAAPVSVKYVGMVMVDDYLHHREDKESLGSFVLVDGSQAILRRAKQINEERESSLGALSKNE